MFAAIVITVTALINDANVIIVIAIAITGIAVTVIRSLSTYKCPRATHHPRPPPPPPPPPPSLPLTGAAATAGESESGRKHTFFLLSIDRVGVCALYIYAYKPTLMYRGGTK